MRDNRLAAAMLAAGRDVVLLPLYTPIRTDEPDVSAKTVYYGGIGVYLRQKSAWYRALPRFVDRLLNRPAILRAAARVHDTGTALFVVGLGTDVNPALLQAIAGDRAHYYPAPEADDLDRIYRALAEVIPCPGGYWPARR